VSLPDKKRRFFDGVQALLGLVEREDWAGRLAYSALLVCLLRVIQCTALHPRLALLTGTVAAALDDLWHAGILTVFLMTCFAAIGAWPPLDLEKRKHTGLVQRLLGLRV
jgi:hypothetical protein